MKRSVVLRVLLAGMVAVLLAITGGLLAAQDGPQVYTGYMGDDVSDAFYAFDLAAGEGVRLSLEATEASLDPFLYLFDPNETMVFYNDDRDTTTLNSYLAFVASQPGTYQVAVSNISGTSGEYRLAIEVVPAAAIYAEMDAQRPALSGAVQQIDTPNFRVHYTMEGADAATPEFAQQVADTLETVYDVQINTMGWPVPPSDGMVGGDGRYDVYLRELDTPDLNEYGAVLSEMPAGDNPATASVENYPFTSFMELDNNYNFEGEEDPLALMQATVAHEFHHAIQYAYDMTDENWYYEATATYMETVTLPGIEAATPYVNDLFTYPEVCFGAAGDADPAGTLMYGHWLFIDSLVQSHGPEILADLWANVAQHENWGALETTLKAYDDNIRDAMARYFLQNLTRDYALAPDFGGVTVWVEGVIESPGTWTFSGRGIQELAANYFELALPPDVYDVRLVPADAELGAALEVWAVGIKGDQAAAYALDNGGALDTRDWDTVYLMVYNPVYDNDIYECVYTGYEVEIAAGSQTQPVGPAFALNAANYLPTR